MLLKISLRYGILVQKIILPQTLKGKLLKCQIYKVVFALGDIM